MTVHYSLRLSIYLNLRVSFKEAQTKGKSVTAFLFLLPPTISHSTCSWTHSLSVQKLLADVYTCCTVHSHIATHSHFLKIFKFCPNYEIIHLKDLKGRQTCSRPSVVDEPIFDRTTALRREFHGKRGTSAKQDVNGFQCFVDFINVFPQMT